MHGYPARVGLGCDPLAVDSVPIDAGDRDLPLAVGRQDQGLFVLGSHDLDAGSLEGLRVRCGYTRRGAALTASAEPSTRGVLPFFALACAITWTLDAPLVLSFGEVAPPSDLALALAGLGAFGPTLAAIAVTAPRGALRSVFTPWRTHPAWIVVALLSPMAVHLGAALVEALLGGEPDRWLHPPQLPEHVVAMVVFSIGEEFGWRGFAHPRLTRRYGAVLGSLLVGAMWAVWHLMMMFSPTTGRFDGAGMAWALVTLPLWSVVLGWLLQRSGGSLAVALALHAGGHLDNATRIPADQLRLKLLIVALLAVTAALAAWSLAASSRRVGAEGTRPP